MVLEKNAQVIQNFCQVLIRSVDDVVDIPALQNIYFTPSKIQYSSSGSFTPNGNLYRKSLVLSYPGISQEDFQKFDDLLKGIYQVYGKLDNGEFYELASSMFPMSCSTRFNVLTGHELVFSSSAPFSIKYIYSEAGAAKPGLPEIFNYDFDFSLD